MEIGVVGLLGLMFVGRFIGEISTGCALTILLALLCWATEAPLLRHRTTWIVGSLRLALVTLPLVVMLTLAKRDFDRDMSPLLGTGTAFTFQHFVQVEERVSTTTRLPTR